MRVGWPITLSAQREILRSQVVERRFVRFGSHGAVPLMHNTAMVKLVTILILPHETNLIF
jgi:hypothetical protein